MLIASDTSSQAHYAIYIVRPVETRKRLEQALSEFVRTQTRNGHDGGPALFSEPTPPVGLTSREVEVLKSLAKGHSTKAIANQLNISSATVNNHIKHILRKLHAHTRLEAIRHAESVGVI
jgi:DNA-binding NarL/FixJ family response regulator